MVDDNPRQPSRIRGAAAGVLAIPSHPAARLHLRPDALLAWLTRCLGQEVERRGLFPWIAVAFGVGILLFFQADGRPALWAPLVGATGALGAALALQRSLAARAVAIGFAAAFCGFAAAVIRTDSVEAPALSRIHIGRLTAFIETLEERPSGARLLLRVRDVEGLSAAERPNRVRVTVRTGEGLVSGALVSGAARLVPPTEAAWPGGYDFGRDAFFRGIGAFGSVTGKLVTLPPPSDVPLSLRLSAKLDAARNALARRIAESIGGPAGAVAAALVTGKRGFIEEETNDVLRGAGIYHIVSISGLHMVLAAGTFFWLSRALLALFPLSALLWPLKKIAALVAMLGATAYCIFSGSEVATERSLIMTLVMFGAILCDREALSMRNLAIAAILVLAREPESLLGPSFQMSFAAVAALIALAGAVQPHLRLPPGGGFAYRLAVRGLQSLAGLIGVTLVAGFATAPFAAYHFQTLNPFGLIGNALALPLVSLAVMPAALLGTLAYPFALDRFVWQAMGHAVEAVLHVSEWVSSFPGATTVVAAFGSAALLLFSVALLLASLFVSALRWAAMLPAAAGLALAATPERFDILVDREGAGAAIRGAQTRLVLVGRPSAFVIEQWLRADGDARESNDPSLRNGARCDAGGCVVRLGDGRAVAWVQDSRAFEEDCARAAIVLTRLRAPATCAAPLLLDGSALREGGATAVRLAGGTPEIVSARARGDPRPWERRASGAGSNPTARGSAGSAAPRPARAQRSEVSEPDLSSGEPD